MVFTIVLSWLFAKPQQDWFVGIKTRQHSHSCCLLGLEIQALLYDDPWGSRSMAALLLDWWQRSCSIDGSALAWSMAALLLDRALSRWRSIAVALDPMALDRDGAWSRWRSIMMALYCDGDRSPSQSITIAIDRNGDRSRWWSIAMVIDCDGDRSRQWSIAMVINCDRDGEWVQVSAWDGVPAVCLPRPQWPPLIFKSLNENFHVIPKKLKVIFSQFCWSPNSP